ncbi:MAG: aromatic ring-hydroxylating dioxygenase subunit alpha [Pseudomonadota bacterium]
MLNLQSVAGNEAGMLSHAMRTVLERVDRPVADANGLPNSFYLSQDFFHLEREILFDRGWAACGFSADVANVGAVYPLDYLGRPAVLVRDSEDRVQAFHNVCRHRGMILVREPSAKNKLLRCPYHSWCYDLKGKLLRTPKIGQDDTDHSDEFDISSIGLTPIATREWMGVVYINFDGKAGDFGEYIAPLQERWAAFMNAPLWHDSARQFDLKVRCNWKLAVENYCESYHLPWVHPSLNSYSRIEDHYDILVKGNYSGQGTNVYSQRIGEGKAFCDHKGLEKFWQTGAEYIAMYPNVLYGAHRDHFYAMLLMPDGHGSTTERTLISYYDDYGKDKAKHGLMQDHADQWRGVFEEDIFAVEGMQAGRESPEFDGGRFTPSRDSATHCFHDWVAKLFLAEA